MIKYIAILPFLLFPFAATAKIGEDVIEDAIIATDISFPEIVEAALALSPEREFLKSKNYNASLLASKASNLFSATPILSIHHQNDRFLSHQGLREWEGSIDFPLWMPGQKSASQKKARLSKEEVAAYEKLVILQIHGQVRELLWELKISQMNMDQARKNLELAQEFDFDVNKKIAAGNLPRQNALLSSSDVIERRLALSVAQTEHIHAARAYTALTGLSQMPDNIEEKVIKQELQAIRAPILQLYDARVDFLDAQYRAVRASWESPPTLSLGVKRESGSYFDRNVDSIGIGVSVPLGSTSHAKSKQAEAALLLAEMERERALLEREYSLELHEAEHELEVCEIQLPLTQEHNEMASRNLELSQKAFDIGETDLLDHLKIREQYFTANAAYNQIALECKRAIARYNQTTGVLLP